MGSNKFDDSNVEKHVFGTLLSSKILLPPIIPPSSKVLPIPINYSESFNWWSSSDKDFFYLTLKASSDGTAVTFSVAAAALTASSLRKAKGT